MIAILTIWTFNIILYSFILKIKWDDISTEGLVWRLLSFACIGFGVGFWIGCLLS